MSRSTEREIHEPICDVTIVLKDGIYKTSSVLLRKVEWFRRQLFSMEEGKMKRLHLSYFTVANFRDYYEYLKTQEIPCDKKKEIAKIHAALTGRKMIEERRCREILENNMMFVLEL